RLRAADAEKRASRQRRSHHIMIAPAQNGFIPNRRKSIHFQMRIGSQQRVAGGAARRRNDPGVASRESRQVGSQCDRLVAQLTLAPHSRNQCQLYALPMWMNPPAELWIFDAWLNQFDQ